MPESVPATEQRVRVPALPSRRRDQVHPRLVEAGFHPEGVMPGQAVGTSFDGSARARTEELGSPGQGKLGRDDHQLGRT